VSVLSYPAGFATGDAAESIGERARTILSLVFSAELALLAFVGSGLFKSLPLFRSFPVDWTVFLGGIVAVATIRRLWHAPILLSIAQAFAVVAVLMWLVYAASSAFWSFGADAALVRLTRGLPLVFATYVATVVLVSTRRDSLQHVLILAPLLGAAGFASTMMVTLSATQLAAKELDAASYIARGIFMALSTTILLGRLFTTNDKIGVKLLLGLAVGALSVGVIVAGSRQALAALVAGAAVAAGVAVSRGRWGQITAVLAITGCLVVSGISAAANFGISLTTVDRLLLIVNTATGGASLNERSTFVEVAIKGFSEAPVLGNGLATFGTYQGLNPLVYPHNLVLEVLFEGGVLGFFLLAIAVSAAGFHCLSQRKQRTAFCNVGLLLLFVVVGVNVSVSGTFTENRLLFLALGLASGAHLARPLPKPNPVASHEPAPSTMLSNSFSADIVNASREDLP